MASKKRVTRVTEEELELLKQLREKNVDAAKVVEVAAAPVAQEETNPQAVATKQLADALAEAIRSTRGPEKKTVFTRKNGAPWWPKNGEPREKMNRVFMQHGIEIERVTNEQIRLLNQLRPGFYCEGWVRVTLRKDRAMDIDYPVRTAAQRLKLVNAFGIRSFTELLERLVDESKNPQKYRRSADLDMFDENPTTR